MSASTVFGQSKKKEGPTISISTNFNYYPSLEPYSFFSTFETDDTDLVLDFVTSNSGTFVIEEDDPLEINREVVNSFPSQLFSMGAGVQIRNPNGSFYEFSITKVSMMKSDYIVFYNYTHPITLNPVRIPRVGDEQKATTFAIKYEYGRYFGRRKRAKVKFGLSGGIEPTFYSYKRQSWSLSEYPIKAKVTTIELSLSPLLAFKLNKSLSVEAKVVPNFLLGDFSSTEEGNPTVPLDEQSGARDYGFPEINVGFSCLVKYIIKEPKKGRRR